MTPFSLSLVLVRLLGLYFFAVSLSGFPFGLLFVLPAQGGLAALFNVVPPIVVAGLLWIYAPVIAVRVARTGAEAPNVQPSGTDANVLGLGVVLLGLWLLAHAIPELASDIYRQWQISEFLNSASGAERTDVSAPGTFRLLTAGIRAVLGAAFVVGSSRIADFIGKLRLLVRKT